MILTSTGEYENRPLHICITNFIYPKFGMVPRASNGNKQNEMSKLKEMNVVLFIEGRHSTVDIVHKLDINIHVISR